MKTTRQAEATARTTRWAATMTARMTRRWVAAGNGKDKEVGSVR